MSIFQIVIGDSQVGDRLDKVIALNVSSLSRTKVQQLIKAGSVQVNSKPEKASYRLENGDTIQLDYEDEVTVPAVIKPEAIPLDVVYEDTKIAAVNKPAGMVVHPAIGHTSGTLVNAILHHWPDAADVGDESRSGIVHRLDKDTSGIILIAKTEHARRYLMAQFKARKVKKRYLALVEGVPSTPTGEINAPIGRHPAQRKRMAAIRDGREAVTIYHILHIYNDGAYSLLELLPKTGRTHQIRVHLALIGHPVVGDTVYGHRKAKRNPFNLKRHFLHAESLEFMSPESKTTLTVNAPLPPDLQVILDKLADS